MRWSPKAPKDMSVWHDWFAWHVVICNGERIWLETVQRRRSAFDRDGSYIWEYK